MKKARHARRHATVIALAILAAGVLTISALALRGGSRAQNTQEPSAETVLPPPEEPFEGKIGETYKDSTMDKMKPVEAPSGAPNVLIILLDDVGYGQASTYGGLIPTPTLDKLARNGLRYTQYHTTALCSPTRAALLGGRNHHSMSTGVITELGTAFPGYSGSIPKSAALVSEVLRQHGYSTSAWGKWHNTPDWETSISGPYDRWPTGLGFDHFYGFMGGETNQWAPTLYSDTTPVEFEVPVGQKKEEYTLNVDLANKAIDWIRNQKSVTPDRPFFVYYAPGATHAPHHVPKSWIAKFKGKFDMGYDKYREIVFENQKRLGVVPAGTLLTSRPKEIPAWDSLTPDQKKVAERLMETFAAYLAQTDYEVGRIIDTLEETGQLEHTLVFYEIGDNGASGEGTPYGVFNEMTSLNGQKENPSYVLKHLDEIGGPNSYNHYNVGWAWAGDTPFQWTKQVASHFGGTRNPLVIYWPERIKDKGEIRSQFHHCIDIVPTILEAAGIPQPSEVNGVRQKPIEGVSMLYSFDNPDARSARRTQYFEMLGTRAVYQDGWVAATRHSRVPWVVVGSTDFNKDEWELYNIEKDFSEANNLASKEPAKLKELQQLFLVEAAKYQVLPLDDRMAERMNPSLRPSLIEGRTEFTYFPGARRIPESSAPNTKNKSYAVTVDVNVPKDGAQGVLACIGGVVGGWSLYLTDSRPMFTYNYFNLEKYTVAGPEKLPPGPATVRFEFTYDGGGLGKGGTGVLFVNGKKVGEGRIPQTVAARFSAEETFDTGLDTGSPVAEYAAPFAFTGTLRKVEVDIAPGKLATTDQKAIRGAAAKAVQAIE